MALAQRIAFGVLDLLSVAFAVVLRVLYGAPKDKTGHDRVYAVIASRISRLLFSRVRVDNVCATVRLWDGSSLTSGKHATRDGVDGMHASRAFSLNVRHPGTLRLWFLRDDPLMGFAESYINSYLDVDGDFEACFLYLDNLRRVRLSLLNKLVLVALLAVLPRLSIPSEGIAFAKTSGKAPQASSDRHSIQRDKDAVAYHYDVGNDFYALFLDGSLGYTSAYFRHDAEPFDDAWTNKYENACRKLQLARSDRIADIGCGWGGFVRHAARTRGTTVHGVTISQRQVDLANERIAADGLGALARVEYRHYKEMPRVETFDKIAAFQCTEHMDERKLHEFFAHMWDLLPPGGLLLVEFMTARVRLGCHPFFDRYVFPDGQQFPLHVALAQAEAVGFELRDVEGMREDYLRTIRQWNRGLAANRDAAEKSVGSIRYRIWRLYLQYAAYAYSINRFNCYQCVWMKTVRDTTPIYRRPNSVLAE